MTNPQGEGIIMRDGSIVKDPRLGRLIKFDERSRNFPIRQLFKVEHEAPRSYTWACNQWLDQGQTSACTGFGVSHELIARPKQVQGITYDSAQKLYRRAQDLDEWEGNDYEGSSALGAIKAAMELGYYDEYRWSFTIDDLAIAVSYFGPAIVGTIWLDNMFNPRPDGFLDVNGDVAGGHLYILRAFNVKMDAFRIRNSWGLPWGISGDAWIAKTDMWSLLKQQGEAAIPVVRNLLSTEEKEYKEGSINSKSLDLHFTK